MPLLGAGLLGGGLGVSGTVLPVPDAPSSLTVGNATTTTLDLSWTDNSDDETGFKVERSADGSTGWTQIGTNTAGDVTYTDTALTAETTYYYRVRAYNDNGDSDYTSTANGTTSAASASALTFRAASTVNQSSFTNSSTIAVPTGVLDGDQMILGVTCASAVTPTVSGWTSVTSETTGTKPFFVFRRTASSEPANYTISLSGSAWHTAGIVAFYSGTGQPIIVEASAIQNNTVASTSHGFPAITASENATLLCMIGIGGAITSTPPAGMAERYDQTGIGQSTYCATVTVTAGNTGSRTATSGSSQTSKTASIAIVEDI